MNEENQTPPVQAGAPVPQPPINPAPQAESGAVPLTNPTPAPTPEPAVPEPVAQTPPPEPPEPPNTPPQASGSGSFAKKFLLGLGLLVILLVATYSVVQILLEKKYATINFPETDEEFIVLNDDEDIDPEEDPVFCGDPGATVFSPNGGEVFVPGQEVLVSWDLCGINLSLLEKVSLVYFDSETKVKEGEVSLYCPGTPDLQQDGTSIAWKVPPYIESGTSGTCPQSSDVDFADGYLYKIFVSYAGLQYDDQSDAYFEIDTTEYVYTPPASSEYSVVADTSFDRASFLDSSAPGPLHDRIFPAFFESPAQFANYYRLYMLGCGSGCFSANYLIDLRDGKAYQTPDAPVTSVSVSSALYVTHEDPNSTVSGTDSSFDAQGRDARITWYEFSEDTKTFTQLDVKYCDIGGAPGSYSYSNCIQP